VDPNADQDDEDWGATLFKTIQGAVTAVAEGGTVTVEPGTYAEQVEITKDLVLKGAGAGKTIIKAPEPVAAWEGSMPDEARYAIVYVHDAADVQIEGITVDGQGKGDEIIGLTGIAFYNAGGSVRNSIIKSLRADSAFARQDGDGVFAQAESGKGPFTLELTGNTISDYQKNGIEISGAVNATILANAVKTEPTSEVAQNGIQLLYGATGKVIGNIVSGNQYTGEWAATGIMLYGSGTGVEVLNNEVKNTDYGISFDVQCDKMTVSDNRISDSEVGVRFDQCTSGTAEVHHNDLSGTEVGIRNKSEGLTVNGEENWWGDKDGPTTGEVTAGAKVEGNVKYDSWLKAKPTFFDLEIDGADEIVKGTSWTYEVEFENRTAATPVHVIFEVTLKESGIDDRDVTLKYSISDSGWTKLGLEDEGSTLVGMIGPDDGYLVQADNSKILKLRLNFDETGDYDLKVRALRAENPGMELASDTLNIDVEKEKQSESGSGSGGGGKGSNGKGDDGSKSGSTIPAEQTPPPEPVPTTETTGSGTVTSEPNENGTATVVARVTSEAAGSATGDLTVDLTASTTRVNVGNVIQEVPVAARVVEIPTDVLDTQVSRGRNLIINTPEATLVIPPASLPRSHAGSVRISVESIDPSQVLFGDQAVISTSLTMAQGQGITPAGPVVMLKTESVTGSGTSAVTTFSQPITVRIPFTQFNNPMHLGVYRLNRSTGEWEYRGGRVNVAGRFVEVELSSFSEYAVMEYTKSFVDVPFSHWAREDIELMAARHIAKGASQHLFMPENQITRAEFAALLVRALRLEPETVMLRNFRDVRPTDWFYGEVATAANMGLVAGSDGAFRPNDPVTRQEMAVMMGRVLTRENMTLPLSVEAARSYIAAYRDADQIADWAAVSVAQVSQLGLMRGRTAVTFDPGATATRAEAVVVLKRLLEAIGQL